MNRIHRMRSLNCFCCKAVTNCIDIIQLLRDSLYSRHTLERATKMVLLQTTPRILTSISQLTPEDCSSLTSTGACLPATCDSPVEHSTIIAISRILNKRKDKSSVSVNTLLRGAHVYSPPPPPKPEPSPEYVALMARLRREQEQREYANLVSKREGADVAEDDGKDDISPSLVLNIFLSVVLCAAAVFQMTRWWSNDGVRVLVSLGTAIVVGVAEVGVYMAYLRKVGMSKSKERRKVERKTVIGEYTGELVSADAQGRPVSIDAAAVLEKEEIWGRGINGGMRRRIREKWDKEQKSTT
jgi:TMEM199 family protein